MKLAEMAFAKKTYRKQRGTIPEYRFDDEDEAWEFDMWLTPGEHAPGDILPLKGFKYDRVVFHLMYEERKGKYVVKDDVLYYLREEHPKAVYRLHRTAEEAIKYLDDHKQKGFAKKTYGKDTPKREKFDDALPNFYARIEQAKDLLRNFPIEGKIWVNQTDGAKAGLSIKPAVANGITDEQLNELERQVKWLQPRTADGKIDNTTVKLMNGKYRTREFTVGWKLWKRNGDPITKPRLWINIEN